MSLLLPNRYPGRFDPTSVDYPQGKFKNRTAPGAKDGSYLERDWANDQLAFFGALLNNAGIVPNGTVDTAQVSQLYDSLTTIVDDSFMQYGLARFVGSATADLNDISYPEGLSKIQPSSDTPLNAPSGTGITNVISSFNIVSDGSEYGFQIGGRNAGFKLQYRSVENGTWSDWIALADESKIFGILQTRQTFSSPDRQPGVIYTNTTNRPIEVSIQVTGTNEIDVITVTVGGVQLYNGDPSLGVTAFTSVPFSFTVLPSETYIVTVSAGSTVSNWVEVR